MTDRYGGKYVREELFKNDTVQGGNPRLYAQAAIEVYNNKDFQQDLKEQKERAKRYEEEQRQRFEAYKAAKEKEEREGIPVSVQTLYSDYETNEAAADIKYKNKKLAVTGTIMNISSGYDDSYYVTLLSHTTEMFGIEIGGVDCYFSNAYEVADLRKGNKITISGKCTGKSGGVELKGCSILNN
jgi:hypothetical protein